MASFALKPSGCKVRPLRRAGRPCGASGAAFSELGLTSATQAAGVRASRSEFTVGALGNKLRGLALAKPAAAAAPAAFRVESAHPPRLAARLAAATRLATSRRASRAPGGTCRAWPRHRGASRAGVRSTAPTMARPGFGWHGL